MSITKYADLLVYIRFPFYIVFIFSLNPTIKGDDVNVLQSCLVVNPITVYSFVVLFTCTAVGQFSETKTILTLNLHLWVNVLYELLSLSNRSMLN